MTTQARDYADFDKKMLALIDAGTNTAAALTTELDADASASQCNLHQNF